MEIAIRVNGLIEQSTATTLAGLVAERQLASRSLVIELNGRVISQADWPTTRIAADDILELLNFVGGG